jgi:hypothetical protein
MFLIFLGLGDNDNSWSTNITLEDDEPKKVTVAKQETNQEKDEKRNLHNKKYFIQRFGVSIVVEENKTSLSLFNKVIIYSNI